MKYRKSPSQQIRRGKYALTLRRHNTYVVTSMLLRYGVITNMSSQICYCDTASQQICRHKYAIAIRRHNKYVPARRLGALAVHVAKASLPRIHYCSQYIITIDISL